MAAAANNATLPRKGRGRARRARRRAGKANGGGGAPSGVNRAEFNPALPARVATQRPNLYTKSGAIPDSSDGVRLQGCEPVAVAAGTAVAGSFVVFLSTILTPANSTLHPWLAAQSPYWTKFMYRAVKLHVVPVKGSTSDGLNWTAFTPDAEIDNPTTLQQAQTMAQQKEAQTWNQFVHTLDLKQEGVEPFYIDTDGADDRLEVQGNIFAGGALGGEAVDATVQPKFQLFIEYVIDLYDRKLNTLSDEAKGLHSALCCPRMTEIERCRAGQLYIERVLVELCARPPRKAVGARRLEALQGLVARSGQAAQALPPASSKLVTVGY